MQALNNRSVMVDLFVVVKGFMEMSKARDETEFKIYKKVYAQAFPGYVPLSCLLILAS